MYPQKKKNNGKDKETRNKAKIKQQKIHKQTKNKIGKIQAFLILLEHKGRVSGIALGI